MSVKRLVAFVLCLGLCLLQSYLYAQDKSKAQFGKVSPADFNLPSLPILDSNTHAVMISALGDIHFVGNNRNWFSPVFKRQIRMKILDKKAFPLASVILLLYRPDNSGDKLNDLTAATYNLENGKVVETKLAKGDIFKEQLSKNQTQVKFTMPAVKEGSIIEYSFTITFLDEDILPQWRFQSDLYPCLWSELNVEIPSTEFYAALKQGIHPFTIDKSSRGSQTYKVEPKGNDPMMGAGGTPKTYYATSTTIKHQWVMQNIPAFHVENYISSPDNYVDKMQFQLVGTYNGEEKTDVLRTWKGATEEWLGNSDYFGTIQEDNDWLTDLASQATENSAGQLAQARAIYYYMSGHFTCTEYNYPFLETSLKNVVQRHSGTVGDINMLMLALLRKEHIVADPVLLSTKDHGYPYVKSPIENRLNYNIVRAVIDGQVYFLDASHRSLGFGRLPDNCYNGAARIISQKDSGFIYFVADTLKEERSSTVIISNNDKGGLEGGYQSTPGLQESYDIREQIRDIGEDKYFSNIQTLYGEDIQIRHTGIDSLNKPETPITIHYDFSLPQNSASSILYFTPILAQDAYKHNPFEAAERKYPVEMPYCIHNTYILNMEIPAGYKVEELPKSVKVALNIDEGAFEYMVSSDGKMIQLRARVKLNRATFPPEDYNSLRDFFGYIVKKESEQIVLKKK